MEHEHHEGHAHTETEIRPVTAFVPDLPWKKEPDFPGTPDVKVLRKEEESQGKTLVVRLPENGEIGVHSHLGAVHHYILEGEYESEGKVHKAGTYRLFPPKADIPKITSRPGATVLILYEPVHAH